MLSTQLDTSRERSNLAKNGVELVGCRPRAESQPRERVIVIAGEQIVERFGAVPAERLWLVVRDGDDVRPAVQFGDRLESARDSGERPGDANDRVVRLFVVQRRVATELRKERPIPVRQQVPGRYTHCGHKKMCFAWIYRVYRVQKVRPYRIIGRKNRIKS